MTLPLVLNIEPEDAQQQLIESRLKGKCTVLAALDLATAMTLFQRHRTQLALIAITSRIPADKDGSRCMERTIGFVRRIKSLVGDRPIVASTVMSDFKNQLMDAGCTLHSPDKLRLYEVILRELQLA